MKGIVQRLVDPYQCNGSDRTAYLSSMVFRTSLDTARKLPRHLRNEEIPSHIFTPRTYQVELLDVAIKKNTIVCLGSDFGKTFLAVMLMKELSPLARQCLKSGGKRSVYLVSSGSMVSPQAQCIRQHTDLRVMEYVQVEELGAWSEDKWRDELNNHQVIITTAHLFYETILHKHLPLSSVNILIMEDCHLALESHPYAHVMQYYKQLSAAEQPRLLGLTSSLLRGHCKRPQQLADMIKNLEDTLLSTAETSNLVTAERHGPCPEQLVFECESREDPTGLTPQLDAILDSALAFLYDCNVPNSDCEDVTDPRAVPSTALTECLHILHELGPWCCGTIATTLIKQLDKIDAHEEAELSKRFLKFAATQLRLVNALFEQHFASVWQVEEFLNYVTPKVVKLISIFREYKPSDDFMIIAEDDSLLDDSDMSDDSMDLSDDDDNSSSHSRQSKPIHIAIKRASSQADRLADNPLADTDDEKRLCGIVFVERRHVAYVLNKLIDEMCAWDTDLYFLKSHHILGDGMKKGGKREALMFKKQEEILRKFRMQEVNLLVSTSVLEEGVDIPKCNLVVRFSQPRDYRSYTQSKSRACARNAQYILLVDESSTAKFNEELEEYKGIERVLLEKCQNRDIVTEEDPSPEQAEGLLPAYWPLKQEGAARVTMTSAISLINRYCAKLPSDAFTHLTPYCALVALGDSSSPQYYATLRLPINSPVKEEVKGEIMTSRKLAQMAVALKTCEILHKEGELDDNLLPVGKEVFRYEDEDNEWEDEVEEGQARPGTTKRKQYYIKKAAQDIQDCCPKPETECVLYELNMKLTGPITDEQNTRGRKLHAPEETSRTFGILLARQIPRVPLFPVYTRSGEVTVSIELVSTDIVVTQEQLDQLLVFHTFVFSNVLRLEKDPMEFSADPMNTSYVVVPLNCLANNPGGLCIDWDFVEHLGKRSSPVEQAKIYDAKREKFLFQTEQFQDAVVMPSYRNIDQPQYFYVAEIRHDLTPVSPFPSPDLYKTFKDYYAVKYGLVITNTEQPLLDVDHTSARLNLLTPRYMNQKGVALPTSSADTKRARRENLQQKQILIPELCDVHVFPASLWRKAVCLPAILYRTNHLLIAEDLRARIARETKIGREKIPSDFCFPKLDFGFDTNPEKIKIESVWENGTNGDMKEGTVSATSTSEENPQPQVHQSSVTTILVENNFNQSTNREIPFVDLQLEVGGVQEGGDSAFSGSTPEDLDSDPGADTFNSVSTDSDSVYNTAQEGDTDMDSDEDLAGPNISDHTLVDQHIGILDNSVIVIDTAVMPLENHFQKLKIVELEEDGSVTPTAEVKCKLTEPSGVHKSDISGQESSFMIKIKQPDSSGNKSSYRDNMKQAGISEQECGYNDNKNQSDISEQDSNYMDDMKQSDISEQDSNYRDDMKQSDIRGQESICMDKIKQSDIRIEFVNTDLAKDINLCANNGVEGGAAGWEDMGTDGEAERVMSLLGPEVLQISDGVVGMICPNSRQLTNETPAATSPDKYASADNTKVEKIKPDTSLKSSPKYTFSIHSEAVCREEEDSIDTSNCATSPVHSACIVDWTSHSENEANHVVNSAQHIKGIDSSSAQHDQVGGKGSATPSAQHSQVGVKGNGSPSTQHGQVGVNGNESPCAQFGQGGINGSESPDVQHGQVGFSLGMISPTPAQCAQLRGSQLDKVDMNKDKTCLISSIVNPVKSVEVSLTAPKEAPPREDPVGIGVWGENVQSVMPTNSSVTNTERVVSLDKDVNLSTFLGPSPCTILQALTMSNANDFFSLERLETIGDSFLKYAITIYLYCTYPGIHEGKLSYLRSKQVSNYNLYRLGKKKGLPESMVSAKFEPNDNWLPSGYVINEGKRRGPVPKVLISSCAVRDKSTAATAPIRVEERSSEDSGSGDSGSIRISCNHRSNGNLSRSSRMANMQQLKFKQELEEVSRCQEVENRADQLDTAKQLLPYNLRTQQIIPDKSVADTVEALIGCYLTSCGKRGALLFMSWLGLRVFPKKDGYPDSVPEEVNNEFEELQVPRSPQLGHVCNGDTVVNRLLDGYDAFEEKISYKFKDRSYLLQAFTHASYHYNTVTDCYQRLEFLGDAILDYVITRHLFEDSRRYSPGVLTDLRSALVNNNIFAALAVKWDFHKYFKAVSPALFYVIERFVSRQKDNEDVIELDDDEDDSDDMEKVEMEIPKALGDIFESVAGAIYLDSAMSLDTVWRVYYRMMKPQIDQYLERIPKSPVRELLEMEPETAKFEKPERTMEGKIRVTVNVVGKGVFTGVGRNYRIAKSAAAKKALKNIKTMQAQGLI